MERKEFLIKELNLTSHPEGGYYKETYRTSEELEHLPVRFSGKKRNISTAIYYLLGENDRSKFHRIKSDEIWHHYEGDAVLIYILDEYGLQIAKLGKVDRGAVPQIVVKQGCWFAAKIESVSGYALSGCTVSPGFDFEDFEMAETEFLISEYPQFKKIINEFS